MNTQRRPRGLRPRALLGGLLVLSSAALLTGCAADAETGDGARSSSLVIAENEPPASFDPIQANNSTVDEVVIPAYDTLLTYDDDQELSEKLATEWSVSDDGTTISMTLRDDVTFHDGEPLTAADVVYTLDRIASLGTGVASFLTSYESSTADSDTELTITLANADAPFLAALTRVYVLNSALVDENAGDDEGQSWLATNDAGSGPYALTSYVANQSASFDRYDDYWGGFDGQAGSVEFRYITEASTQLSALQGGDVDIAMDIAPTDRASFEGQDGFTVDASDTNVVLYSFFDMTDPVTSNPALREAVSYAYDYQQHVDSILLGAGQLVDGPVPSGMQCSTTDVEQPTLDLDRARQIVDDNGLGGTTLTMTYLEATTEMEQAATLLQSNLAEIGITLELQAVTYPQYAEMAADDATRPQLGMIYAFPAFPDTSAVMYQNYNSQFIGSQNWGAYSNPEVDELTNAAQVETDQDTRCEQYVEAEQIVTSDHAAVNMANAQIVAVMDDRVQGYTYRPAHHQTVDVYAITLTD